MSIHPEVIHEHKVTTEHNDVLECGVLRTADINSLPIAYAALGKTHVAIFRGEDGKVHIEIDDTAEEPVHVTANAETLVAAPGEPPHPITPWHSTNG